MKKLTDKIWQIVIEGHNEEQMYDLFEDIQNEYNLYDNCVISELPMEDTIFEPEDRTAETGGIFIDEKALKAHFKKTNEQGKKRL